MLQLSKLRKTLPFNINHGTTVVVYLKNLLDSKYHIEIDWDVYLPSKKKNLQRPFVWTLHQKQELIWSVIKGIKIPDITVIQYHDDMNKEKQNQIYKIIDGKQRLSTLLAWIKNEFTIEYNGENYYFKDFDEDGRRVFNSMSITGSIGYEYPDKMISDDDKISWFEMINFAGTPQDIQHLENLKSNNQ